MNFNLKEYYPIGTICKIKGYSGLFMIIGFQKNLYDNELLTYDYEACEYPYGTLSNNNILFNSNEIEEIIFTGYETQISDEEELEIVDNDDNSSEKIYVDDEIIFVKNDLYNQLLFDKDGKVLIAEDKLENEEKKSEIQENLLDDELKEINEKYKFDENGILIAINEDGEEEKIQPDDLDDFNFSFEKLDEDDKK